MRITFLGTGTSQGVPVIGCNCSVCTSADPRDTRLRSSILIESEDTVIVIDTGPDFRQQMLSVSPAKLDAVLFTHAHRDHIAGLDDVRPFIHRQGKPMDVFAEQNVEEDLRVIFFYAFSIDKYPGVPEFTFHTIKTEPFKINRLEIIPIRGLHYRLPVLGFRIGDFVYMTDMNRIPEHEKQKLSGVKHLVLGALRTEHHISHFSLSEALAVVAELNPANAYFTHISHEMGLHTQVSDLLPERTMLAYDGMVIVD